jgi:hypothetical protein
VRVPAGRSSIFLSRSRYKLLRASGRSPDLRILELRLPSQGLRPSGFDCLALHAYSGGAVPDFHRLPK